MSNPIFEWFNKPPAPERPMPKIKRKVAFKRIVITERNECWGYNIINGKPGYFFMYSFYPETYNYSKSEMPLTVAEIKSIKRNRKKKCKSLTKPRSWPCSRSLQNRSSRPGAYGMASSV